MACLKTSKLWKETDKVYKKWSESKTLERWGLTDDLSLFKRLFETATDKPFLEGSRITDMDMKKMDVAIKNLESDLKSPGNLDNKFIRNFYVGSAVSMRNPTTKSFYETLVNANEFRNSNSNEMFQNYREMISSLKESIINFEGISGKIDKFTIPRKRFKQLRDKEKEIVIKMKNKEVVGTANEWSVLQKFLDNEGSVFEDFILRVEDGTDSSLKYKYRDDIENKKSYINSINTAASKWSAIQTRSKKNLLRSINNLSELITIKYGEKSNTSKFLVEEYNQVAKKLEKSEGKYIPHYILDLLGHSIEISDRITKSKSDTQRDNILKEYVEKTREINTNLLQRLRERSDKPSEYFSRNPMLYADKYMEQVVQFNHNTYVDLAYTKGLKKLTETAFRNEGTKEGKAAKVYLDIFNDMYNSHMNKESRIDTGSPSSNVTRLLTSLQFISKLGLSPRGAIRNATQRLLNYSYFGHTLQLGAMKALKNGAFKQAMNNELNYHGLQFTDISKVSDGAVTSGDLLAKGIDYEKGILTFKDKETVLEMLTQKASKAADKSSVLTKAAENWNRAGTFKVAFYKRVEQLRKTDKFSNAFTDSALEKEMYRSAGNYAAKLVSLLHFEYSPAGKAKIVRGKVGAVLGQFQHYAMSFANLQTQMLKDYKNAFKAGDYTGEELQRIIRLGLIYGIANAVSGVSGVNFTTYVNNDTFGRVREFSKLLLGDEEEKKEAFYGKGLVGAAGLVPVSDAIELYNFGAAAGFYDLLADEDSMVGLLSGMREYKALDNSEFAKEAAGMLSIQVNRLFTRTIPAFKSKGGIVAALRSELALYPGETSFGIDTRVVRKKLFGKKDNKRSINYKNTPYKSLTKKQKESALQSLRILGR